MATHFVEAEFVPRLDELLPRLGLEAGSDEAGEFADLLARLGPLARPRAAFMAAPARADAETGEVGIGTETFRSRLLAANLAGKKLVWPHLATCGREMHAFTLAIPDPFERFWCEEIMQSALAQARAEMLRRLEREFEPGRLAAMAPGSLAEWPIEEQLPLFRLMAEGARLTGIELTPSLLMLPNKSVSGILFQSENGWESCMLCRREKCQNRRAEYDAAAEIDRT